MEALENIKDSISKDLEETRNKKKELSKKFTQAKVWHCIIHVHTVHEKGEFIALEPVLGYCCK